MPETAAALLSSGRMKGSLPPFRDASVKPRARLRRARSTGRAHGGRGPRCGEGQRRTEGGRGRRSCTRASCRTHARQPRARGRLSVPEPCIGTHGAGLINRTSLIRHLSSKIERFGRVVYGRRFLSASKKTVRLHSSQSCFMDDSMKDEVELSLPDIGSLSASCFARWVLHQAA